jgi:hypothetical protein
MLRRASARRGVSQSGHANHGGADRRENLGRPCVAGPAQVAQVAEVAEAGEVEAETEADGVAEAEAEALLGGSVETSS